MRLLFEDLQWLSRKDPAGRDTKLCITETKEKEDSKWESHYPGKSTKGRTEGVCWSAIGEILASLSAMVDWRASGWEREVKT